MKIQLRNGSSTTWTTWAELYRFHIALSEFLELFFERDWVPAFTVRVWYGDSPLELIFVGTMVSGGGAVDGDGDGLRALS